VIAKHEAPKVRLPKRLPSRAPNEKELDVLERIESVDEDEQEDEPGTWDRQFVKSFSLKALRNDAKRKQHAANNAAATTTINSSSNNGPPSPGSAKGAGGKRPSKMGATM
jgi:hypothetical protein